MSMRPRSVLRSAHIAPSARTADARWVKFVVRSGVVFRQPASRRAPPVGGSRLITAGLVERRILADACRYRLISGAL